MRGRWSRVLLYAALGAGAVFYLLPVYALLVTGFKSFQEVNLATMWNLPSGLHLDNFREAFAKLDPHLLNSLSLATTASVLSSLLGSLNGYVLSKWRFRGSNLLFMGLLFGMFIPYQSILIPLVRFMQSIRLYGTLWGLVLTHVVYGIPMTTLIFRNYYASIPNEMIEAARMDGAGLLGIYRYVMLPLAIPGFVVALIWQFTSIWNEFLFAVTLTRPQFWPVTVALQNLAGSQIVEWNVQMAGALIAALPTLLIYIVLGRFFLRGLMAGALKG
ncbi:MAG: carbohydrate ABC transporter permease [Chloroflexota bacterium]